MNNFLSVLFKDIPENLYINIWTLPSKKSRWLKPYDDLPPFADGTDVYFGVCPAPTDLGPNKRITANLAAGLVGLWADVDFGPGHVKAVPPDEATAGRLIKSCGLHPSLAINSGNGFHCYWLLDQPWLFQSDAERQAGAQLVEQWQGHLRTIFQAEGYTLDATHDLARVLRIPGTCNYKDPENVKKVEIIYPQDGELNNLLRYTPNDFREKINNKQPRVKQVYISPKISEKVGVLLSNDRRFAATWFQERTDLKDTSPSGYDLSLATQAAMAGWTAEEIQELVHEWRRIRGHDIEKLKRSDYLPKLIAKAQLSGSGVNFPDKLSDLTAEDSKEYLDALADIFGFPVKKFIRQGQENTQYSMILTDDTEINIGTANSLLSIRTFRGVVFDATGKAIPSIKEKDWYPICQFIFKWAEFVVDEDSKRGEILREWLDRWLAEQHYIDSNDDQWKDGLVLCNSFARDGILYIHAREFLKFIRWGMGEKFFELAELRNGLRKLGFMSSKISIRKGETVHCRGYWSILLTALELQKNEAPQIE